MQEPSGAHVDMWHVIIGRKSTINNKVIRGKSNEPLRG